MSYGFSIVAASKAAALVAVAAELDKVVAAQPIHEADRPMAEAAADAFIGLVNEPTEGQQVTVSVNGYVTRYDAESGFTSACVGVTASVVTKTE